MIEDLLGHAVVGFRVGRGSQLVVEIGDVDRGVRLFVSGLFDG